MTRLPKLPDPDSVFSVIDKASSVIDKGLGLIDKASDRLDKIGLIEEPRAPETPTTDPESPKAAETITEEEKASSVEAGCVPCAVGHFSTCSGLLNEAMRFAKKDGIGSGEVIDRVGMCMDELNALERVDLRPELIVDLPDWEKELANKSLVLSRATRHGLEGLTTSNDLEKVAASTQTARTEIGRKWFKERLARMPKEEKEKLAEKAIEKLEEE